MPREPVQNKSAGFVLAPWLYNAEPSEPGLTIKGAGYMLGRGPMERKQNREPIAWGGPRYGAWPHAMPRDRERGAAPIFGGLTPKLKLKWGFPLKLVYF